MRTPLALAVLALVAAGLPLAAVAQAAAPMCQGEEATIVGVNGSATGTDGDDVIVLTTTPNDFAPTVSAGDGDDLICVNGTLRGDVVGEGGAVITGGGGEDSLVVRAGRDGDVLILDASTEKLDVALGDGFDELRLLGAVGSGVLDAGKRGGTLKLYDFDEVRLDLEDHRLKLDEVHEYEVTGFFRAFASGRRVILNGDAGRNGLSALACRTTLRGGGGEDTLQAVVNKTFEDCTPKGAHLFGMNGDDRLTGTARGDVLIGGKGRDKADGQKGVDRCAAEQETRCER